MAEILEVRVHGMDAHFQLSNKYKMKSVLIL